MEKSVSKEDEGPDKIPNCCNVFPSNSRASALFAFSADPVKTFLKSFGIRTRSEHQRISTYTYSRVDTQRKRAYILVSFIAQIISNICFVENGRMKRIEQPKEFSIGGQGLRDNIKYVHPKSGTCKETC